MQRLRLYLTHTAIHELLQPIISSLFGHSNRCSLYPPMRHFDLRIWAWNQRTCGHNLSAGNSWASRHSRHMLCCSRNHSGEAVQQPSVPTWPPLGEDQEALCSAQCRGSQRNVAARTSKVLSVKRHTLLGGHMGDASQRKPVETGHFICHVCSNWTVNGKLFPPGSSWDGNCCPTPAA